MSANTDMKSILMRANEYLAGEEDPKFRGEVEQLIEDGDEERLRKELSYIRHRRSSGRHRRGLQSNESARRAECDGGSCPLRGATRGRDRRQDACGDRLRLAPFLRGVLIADCSRIRSPRDKGVSVLQSPADP